MIGKLTGFAGVAAANAAKGLRLAPVLLVAATALMTVVSALVISGWKVRLGAVLLHPDRGGEHDAWICGCSPGRCSPRALLRSGASRRCRASTGSSTGPSHRDAGGRQAAALSALAWHIRGITALAIAFVVVGALIRLGGLG